jgi:alpha-tubulin suppressor-like RCC1 family protein
MSSLRRFLVVLSLTTTSVVALAEVVDAHGPAGGATSTATDAGGKLTAGSDHACSVLEGKVYCWGSNGRGQLGSVTTTALSSNVPVEVTGISTAVTVVAGYAHTCALLDGGDVWCWGSNEAKQLARATGTTGAPAKVEGISGASAIGAGNGHSCALIASTGGVMCWGENGSAFGSLLGRSTPNGNVDPDPVPGYVRTLDGNSGKATKLAVGHRSACVVMENGTVKCWGENSDGRLGDGTRDATTDLQDPTTVLGLTNVVAVTVGYNHACAVVSGGKMWCWGSYFIGQLGNDLSLNEGAAWAALDNGQRPVEVVAARGSTDKFTDALHVSAGMQFTCATRVNGTAWCWGSNNQGELGTGGASNDYILAPVNVAELSDAVVVEAGNSFACAMNLAQVVKCWGMGGVSAKLGQIGNGTNTEALTPATVTGVVAQTITFAAPSDKALGDAAFTVSATSSSGGAVSFESTTTSICTVSGSTVTLVGPGTCTISASRAAYGLYKAADSVSRSFKVAGLKPTVKTGTATPQSTKATLRGAVNAGGTETAVNFVFGTDPALVDGTTVKATTQTSSTDEEVLAVITDLKESTKYYFRIEASNAVGSATGDIGSFTTIGPEGVSINDGDEFTNSINVVVSVVGPSNATKILVSNDGGFKNASPFDLTNSAADIPWKLVASRSGTFTKTVYVRFLSRFDSKVTDDKTDDIILDTSKPRVTAITAARSAAPASAVTVAAVRAKSKASTGVKLNVRASDTISGAVAIEVRSAAKKRPTLIRLGKAPSKVKTMGMPRLTTAAITVRSTAKALQVRAVDGAGNTSAWVKVTVKR